MAAEPILQVQDLDKSFPGVQALSQVRLEIQRGTVHALMGENGAGKSTLMKILAGFYPPDAGELLFKGRGLRLRCPHDALRQGISMIHQELLPFPELAVMENIFMGHEPAGRFTGWLDRRRMRSEAERLLGRLGVPLPPLKKMKQLRVAEMQTVEIAKALAHRSEVIIMDEPTSAISEPEVDALFEVIRELKRQGVAVIYISHRMDEVFRIADLVTVLRDGRYVDTREIGGLDADSLIALMVGRKVGAGPRGAPGSPGEVALRVDGLTRAGCFHDITLELRRGEVLGLAGLMGAGRTELARAIFGLDPADSGEIAVHGSPMRRAGPREAIAKGIALVSEDRRKYGLVANMSVKHNITLSDLRRLSRRYWIDRGAENRVADEQMRALSIRAADRDQRVAYLSGGNQQKVVMAKALLTEPAILILDEPTRGIDVAAKAEVHAIVRGLARAGKAVLMASSELPEVLSLSDRILVMREGRITAELDPRRTTQEEVMKHAMPAAAGKETR